MTSVSISSKLFKYQRATALSWIRNNKKRIKFDVSSDEGLLDKIKSLEQELEKERAKNYFIKELMSKLTNKVKFFSENKRSIIKTVEKYKKWNSIKGTNYLYHFK